MFKNSTIYSTNQNTAYPKYMFIEIELRLDLGLAPLCELPSSLSSALYYPLHNAQEESHIEIFPKLSDEISVQATSLHPTRG